MVKLAWWPSHPSLPSQPRAPVACPIPASAPSSRLVSRRAVVPDQFPACIGDATAQSFPGKASRAWVLLAACQLLCALEAKPHVGSTCMRACVKSPGCKICMRSTSENCPHTFLYRSSALVVFVAIRATDFTANENTPRRRWCAKY